MAASSCSWCHHINDVGFEFCALCGHNAHRPRVECNCDYCAAWMAGPQLSLIDERLDAVDSDREQQRSQMRDV